MLKVGNFSFNALHTGSNRTSEPVRFGSRQIRLDEASSGTGGRTAAERAVGPPLCLSLCWSGALNPGVIFTRFYIISANSVFNIYIYIYI